MAAALALAGWSGEAAAQLITLARRIELNVLVLSAGDVGTEMVKAGLREASVPYTELELESATRPAITDAFLSDAVSMFVKRSKFQALVTPNEAPAGLRPDEQDALARWQREFKTRRLSSYVFPSPAVHMHSPGDGGYIGTFDGFTALVTPAGREAGFDYLVGPVPFDDHAPGMPESYGYLATAMAEDPTQRRSLSALLEIPIPGSAERGVLAGVVDDDGREQLILTCALNPQQLQQQAIFQGILNWLTRGVHLGTERNYLSVHVDDLFLANTRWVPDHDCTRDSDCPPDVIASDILMTPADVDYLIAWQERVGFKVELAYNGGGYDQFVEQRGAFPLGEKLLQNKARFRWINHTYMHEFLGCRRDMSRRPLRCISEPNGDVSWVSYPEVQQQIIQNIEFADRHGLPIARDELITGEHGGLRRAPDEPSDNPELLRATSEDGIRWLASDNSRESAQRRVGSAGDVRTVPRYPTNLFFNVATRVEEVDEYNWLYTSAADGGSGVCASQASSTCIVPLASASAFEQYIVPQEARIALLHVLSNSPRPHYAHQSNLAEDRLLYPLLDRILGDYRRVFGADAPLVSASLTEAGIELRNAAQWQQNRTRVSAYVQAGQLTLAVSGSSSVQVPLTLPRGSHVQGETVLAAYAGTRTGWRTVMPLLNQALSLPAELGYAE